jgi:hypothetical protein
MTPWAHQLELLQTTPGRAQVQQPQHDGLRGFGTAQDWAKTS